MSPLGALNLNSRTAEVKLQPVFGRIRFDFVPTGHGTPLNAFCTMAEVSTYILDKPQDWLHFWKCRSLLSFSHSESARANASSASSIVSKHVKI